MRKLILPLLLASALVPAAAAAQDSDSLADRIRERAERSERAQRSERADRPMRAERTQRNEASDGTDRAERPQRAQRTERVQRPERSEDGERAGRIQRIERFQRSEQADVGDRANPPQRIERIERQAVNSREERRTDWGVRRPTLVDGFRAAANDMERRRQGEAQGSDRDSARDGRRDGSTRWADHRRDNRDGWSGDRNRRDRWSGDWRRDRRYDWRDHRSRHGSIFRLGRYYDPFGWGYRRFSIGFSLRPSYYSSNYWLNDTWSYRLPPAYGPYRWVRYYDDALLVNIYSGQVVDVIHSFFW